jgi:hypothetical protein
VFILAAGNFSGVIMSDTEDTIEDTSATLYRAVSCVLDRIQDDPNIRYYCGSGTEIFTLLAMAEAAYLDKPLVEVEEYRLKDLQPEYRRRDTDLAVMRRKRDELQTILNQWISVTNDNHT